MYQKKRNIGLSNGRKVQFAEGFGATVTSYKFPKKREALQKGGKKLAPLNNSPAPPTMSSGSPRTSDISLPSISERRASNSKSPPQLPERRFSLSMSKEKKAELLSALKEQKLNIERRSTNPLPQDGRGSFPHSIDASYSKESDDFVDNLTKQKMNLQLKSVTERLSEVYIETRYVLIDGMNTI